MLKMAQQPVSLHAPVGDDGDVENGDSKLFHRLRQYAPVICLVAYPRRRSGGPSRR